MWGRVPPPSKKDIPTTSRKLRRNMGGWDTTMEEQGAVDMKTSQYRLLTKWKRGTILLWLTKKFFGKISFGAMYRMGDMPIVTEKRSDPPPQAENLQKHFQFQELFFISV